MRKLDKIIVLDLESTCWEKNPPQGQSSDIIEIGLCTVDVQTLEIDNGTSIIVIPASSTISAFCTKLTTITPEMVANGVSFLEAIKQLQQFNSNDRTWASFGDYDRNMIDRQCKKYGVNYPFGPRHINVKSWFALTLGLDREIGLDGALKRLNLPLDGTHHRGIDDALNIAKVLVELLKAGRSKLN